MTFLLLLLEQPQKIRNCPSIPLRLHGLRLPERKRERIENMRAEAVRIAFKFRRKNLQGIYQSPVPRDLHIEECDDIVVREPVFIEFVVLVSDLLQGICQVEGKVLLL